MPDTATANSVSDQPTSPSLPSSSSKATPAASPVGVGRLPATIVVRVTDEDLLLGARRNGRECPIARATRRSLQFMGFRTDRVLVGGVANNDSVVEIGRAMYRGNGIADFITCWDCSGPAEPTTFVLVRLARVDQHIQYSLTGKQS